MTTPLPQSLQKQDTECPKHANTGLWYDKFCNQWCKNRKNKGIEAWSLKSFKEGTNEINPKFDWIKTVIGNCGDSNLLKEYTDRLAALADQRGGGSRVFSSLYRFVSGLGREHPVENGFAWHHTLGVPYLPGSSVKGMLRSYLATWVETDKAEIKRIFAPRQWKDEQGIRHDTEHAIGSVIFLDAMPIAPVPLQADVMTPHYGPYYQDKNGLTAPGDWHSPNPIPFLTVGEGAKFLFAVLPRTGSGRDKEDCGKVLGWLAEALKTIGAGAKTAIGYGRFQRDEEEENRLTQAREQREKEARAQREKREREAIAQRQKQIAEARRATLSPLAQDLDRASDDGNWETDKDKFTREFMAIDTWLAKLEQRPEADALALISKLIQKHYSGLLENPEKTQGKKNNPVFKENQRKIAHRIVTLRRKLG